MKKLLLMVMLGCITEHSLYAGSCDRGRRVSTVNALDDPYIKAFFEAVAAGDKVRVKKYLRYRYDDPHRYTPQGNMALARAALAYTPDAATERTLREYITVNEMRGMLDLGARGRYRW